MESKNIEWMKYILAVAVGAFLAGVGTIKFINSSIDTRLIEKGIINEAKIDNKLMPISSSIKKFLEIGEIENKIDEKLKSINERGDKGEKYSIDTEKMIFSPMVSTIAEKLKNDKDLIAAVSSNKSEFDRIEIGSLHPDDLKVKQHLSETDGFLRELRIKVTFSQPFSNAPTVIAGFTQIEESTHSERLRVSIEPEIVTKNDVLLVVTVRNEGGLNDLGVFWVAKGRCELITRQIQPTCKPAAPRSSSLWVCG